MIQRCCVLVAVATLASVTPLSARAGGLGVFDVTGFHAGIDPGDAERGGGAWFDQGGGIELLIGPRQSRIAGRARVFYHFVTPTLGNSTHFGVALFGLEVQLLRDLEKPWGLHAHLDLGPGFLAVQHEEFGMADLGVGIHRDLADHLTLFAEISGQLRFRHLVWGGAVLTAGLRIPID